MQTRDISPANLSHLQNIGRKLCQRAQNIMYCEQHDVHQLNAPIFTLLQMDGSIKPKICQNSQDNWVPLVLRRSVNCISVHRHQNTMWMSDVETSAPYHNTQNIWVPVDGGDQ
jgi:hypothetical protein